MCWLTLALGFLLGVSCIFICLSGNSDVEYDDE